jgi:hypothetical protein
MIVIENSKPYSKNLPSKTTRDEKGWTDGASLDSAAMMKREWSSDATT